MEQTTKTAHSDDSAAETNKKPVWCSPKLQHIGSLSEIVLSGAGKGTKTNEGNAGGGSAEFKPGS